ncbi:MAG TPA: methyltransferase domain-containing protein [Acidimicrobiales bacterium]|nr:methyltransferase domain-containing protein [Acidimicrobiales bacterium]
MRNQIAGDFDYEHGGNGYARHRRADPRIAAQVHRSLGDARTVVNVGAGAGSYEPDDRHVVAVEPSAAMRAQRPRHLAPAVDATAEALPYDDGAFDAAMAMVTVHQWPDLGRGLDEMRRVARGPVVIVTFDGDVMAQSWLGEYAPELVAVERGRMPALDRLAELLGGRVTVDTVPLPFDCTDGFGEAFYGRPERMLEAEVRAAQSAWGFVDAGVEARFVERLSADLASGAWDRRYGHLRQQPTFDGSLRLVTAVPG